MVSDIQTDRQTDRQTDSLLSTYPNEVLTKHVGYIPSIFTCDTSRSVKMEHKCNQQMIDIQKLEPLNMEQSVNRTYVLWLWRAMRFMAETCTEAEKVNSYMCD